jgi:hypothetical protein
MIERLSSLFIVIFCLFLAGCGERPSQIDDASLPQQYPFDTAGEKIWLIRAVPNDDGNLKRLDSNALFLFKNSCRPEDEGQEIGFKWRSDIANEKAIYFALDDKFLEGDRYKGIAKGDCVYMKTDHTYVFGTKYRSNIVRLR